MDGLKNRLKCYSHIWHNQTLRYLQDSTTGWTFLLLMIGFCSKSAQTPQRSSDLFDVIDLHPMTFSWLFYGFRTSSSSSQREVEVTCVMSCGRKRGEEKTGGPPDVVTRILFSWLWWFAQEALHVADSWLPREMIWSIMWPRECPAHQEMSLRDARVLRRV